MNKDLVVNNTRKKFKGELLDIILNQINNYFKLVNSNYQIHHNIGDEVILNENHLLHGIRDKVNLLKIFSERGIVSNDYFIDEISNHAFILNTSNKVAKRIKENNIFRNKNIDKYKYSFIHEKAVKDFENGFKLDVFERADYIIFGFPKNCIEGILVGRVVENNQEYLKEIKSLFPNSYICNLDGKVIMK